MVDGNIYIITLTEYKIPKFEPIEQVGSANGLTPPPVELSTTESRSLPVYDVAIASFETADFAEILADSTQETLSLISLAGTVLEIVTYWDYAEAEFAIDANATNDVAPLQFHYFPLEPLNLGDQVQV